MEEMLIKLEKPATVGDMTCESITLREPTAGELEESWNPNNVAMVLKLVARMNGLPLALVRQIGARDFAKIDAALLPFMQAGQTTGAN